MAVMTETKKRKKKCPPIPQDATSRLMKRTTSCKYTGMGYTKMRAFSDAIGATVKIGRSVFYDRYVIDAYFDRLAKERAAVIEEKAQDPTTTPLFATQKRF